MILIFLLTSVLGKIYEWRHVEDMFGLFPSAKYQHSQWTVDRTLYIFGGCDEQATCNNNLHSYDQETFEWKRLNSTGIIPSPRGGQSASVIGNRVFVYGGSEGSYIYDDMFVYDVTLDSWEALELQGEEPAGRTNHAMDVDPDGNLVVFGGFTTNGYDNSVFVFDTLNWKWSFPTPSGLAPTARELTSLTVYKRLALVFGGFKQGGVSNELYALDMETWEWVSTTDAGYHPEPREGHAAVRIGQFLYIIGGWDFAIKECYNDTNILDIMNMWWTKLNAPHNDLKSKEQLTASAIGSKIYTFGGRHLTDSCNQDFIDMETGVHTDCGTNGEMREGLCICSGSYTGLDCGIQVSCKDDCNNHGECRNTGQCACNEGRTGSTCEIEVTCPEDCSGHGRCRDNGTCQCDDPYTGKDCSEEFSSSHGFLQVDRMNATMPILLESDQSTRLLDEIEDEENNLNDGGILKALVYAEESLKEIEFGEREETKMEERQEVEEKETNSDDGSIFKALVDAEESLKEIEWGEREETKEEERDEVEDEPSPDENTLVQTQDVASMLQPEVGEPSSLFDAAAGSDNRASLRANRDDILPPEPEALPCDCSGNGKCVEGECYCEVGFYGDNCEFKQSDDYWLALVSVLSALALGLFLYWIYWMLQGRESDFRPKYKKLTQREEDNI